MHLDSRRPGKRARLALGALLALFAIGCAGTARGAEALVPFTGEKSSWHGFDRYDFLMDEQTLAVKPATKAGKAVKGQRPCIVVVPNAPATGNPWSWQACYWDHEPQTEVELLKRGFHIAFIGPNGGIEGRDKAWDAWYRHLTEKHGLAKRAAFVGMSKGGVNEYSWGVVNPEKVACIYADNPALWDEDFARLPALANHDVSLLHVCGSEDFLVNRYTRFVEDTYHSLGGSITVIIKDGHAHHRHSLQNPRLIADWIEQHMTPSTANKPAFVDAKFTKRYYYSLEPKYIHLKEENSYATARGPGFTECYDRYDSPTSGKFKTGGFSIVVPRTVAPGKPWVFTGDALQRDATVEQALLAKGYHILIISPLGSGFTQKQWNDAYKLLVENGFSNKPVLKGIGPKAGEAYAWAVANPDKVSCIYARNPLMKSLMAGKQQPIDNLATLAKVSIPVLHDCGALDPWLENQTRVVEKRYNELGGKITVIVREGEGHFPLSPNDSKSVVDFIVSVGPRSSLSDKPAAQKDPPEQGRTSSGDSTSAAEKPAGPAITGPLSSTAPIDVRLYGAKGDGTTDDTAAFQAALEAAKATSMKVYAPRARYLFAGRLNVPAGMTLEGSFDSVTSHPRGGRGGRGGRVGQPDGTMFLVTGDVGKEDAPAFITLNGNSTLRGVAILYPEQSTTDTPKAYPYSVAMRGNNPAVLDVELINSYNGIDASRNQRHLIRNVSGQPLHIGVFVDGITDIGRIENVHFNPWWGGGGAVRKFMMEKGVAFIFGRSDWEYVLNTFCFGYNTGYKFIRSKVSRGNCNGNFLGIGADDCHTAVLVEESAPFGLLITNGEFVAFHGPDPTEVHVPASNRGSVRFVNCAFWGPGNQIAKIAGGTVGFSDCTFVEWGGKANDLPAIQATAGTVIIRGCEFIKRAPAINLGEEVRRAVITGNVFSLPEARAGIVNKSTGNVQIGLNSFGAAGGGPADPARSRPTAATSTSSTGTSATPETLPVQPAESAKRTFDKNSPFYFDGTISRQTLENYLDRAITMGYFLVPGRPEGYQFPYRDDDVRMIHNLGAKFIGRAIYRWGQESQLGDPAFLAYAKKLVDRVHTADPEVIFQGCLFESVSADVNKLKIPAWVFVDFGLPVEDRTFSRVAIIKREGRPDKAGGRGGVPIINNLETRLWFYYLAVSYINIGCEALHLGQVRLIGADDRDLRIYSEFLTKVRAYAKLHARRHLVLLDGHVPSGGMVKDGVSLLDFNSFPMRIKAVPGKWIQGKPQEAVLEVGHLDAIFKRSKGCVSPSGWRCDSLPYLVEFDNFGRGRNPNVADPKSMFCWGWDEISWFAQQPEDYRNQWLNYAHNWIKQTDPNGHLQMPGIRMLTCPNETLRSYFANSKSKNCPVGYSQEETIKRIWIKNAPIPVKDDALKGEVSQTDPIAFPFLVAAFQLCQNLPTAKTGRLVPARRPATLTPQ